MAEPDITDFEPGCVFEKDGELYLVEERHVTMQVVAQRIDSHRDLFEKFRDGGDYKPITSPVFAQFEGELDHGIWSELTPLTPKAGE